MRPEKPLSSKALKLLEAMELCGPGATLRTLAAYVDRRTESVIQTIQQSLIPRGCVRAVPIRDTDAHKYIVTDWGRYQLKKTPPLRVLKRGQT